MSLSIQTSQKGDVTLVACSGRITLGEETAQFRDTLRGLIKKGDKKILLDLGNVSYLDSSGIGELVGSFTSASNVGATMKLACLTRKIHDLLQITKLLTVFEVFDNDEAAIKSFA